MCSGREIGGSLHSVPMQRQVKDTTLVNREYLVVDSESYLIIMLFSLLQPYILGHQQGRQFLSRSEGDESRDCPLFADLSRALSYVIIKCKVWTPRRGMALWHAPGQFG